MNLNLNSSGDLDFTNNNFVLVEGSEEIKQLVQVRISTFLGEWFLDSSRGIPWFQDILKKNPNPVIVDAVLKNTVLETDGIKELISWDLDYDSSLRTLDLTFEAKVEDNPNNIIFSMRIG